MKEFLEPSLEVRLFSVEDIVTASDFGGDGVVGKPGDIDWVSLP